MLIDKNEYGAPWNDQFYWITIQDDEGVQWEELLTLSGPKVYTHKEILNSAINMFPYYEIVNIRPYEVYR